MPKEHYRLKLFLSAMAGLLVAAMLVVFPGTGLVFMRPSTNKHLRDSHFYRTYWDVWMHYRIELHHEPPAILDEISQKAFWLCIAENEINCWPFLLGCTSIGPIILIHRRLVRKTNKT